MCTSLKRSRPLALLLLVLHLSACAIWRPYNVSPAQLIEDEALDRLRVTGPDGRQVILRDAYVHGDSVSGRSSLGELRGYALDEVQIEVQDDGVGPAVAVGVVVVGLLFALVSTSLSVCDGGGC